jgi:hypothetical protein
MTIDEAWDRWLNSRAEPLTSEELQAAKTAFYAAFAAGAGEGAAFTAKMPTEPPSHGMLVAQMIRLFRELVRREGEVAVLLYGPSMAAVLENDMPLLRSLVAAIELEKDIDETEADPDDADPA